ncbi:MAG: carboxypeptidase-like regulatory domain-containing protein, partial [Terriglobales bacterium]
MKPIGANRIIQIGAIILVLSGCVVTISCSGLSSGSAANSGSTKPAGASSYSISGTITPAANASGVTLTLSGTAKATATVNSSGNYSFSGLANGSYTITPSKSGFVFAPSKQTITVSSADVAGMDFGSAPAQLWSIQGTVTPAGGSGGATVTLSGASDAITTSDASGNYVFSDLGSGSYTVTPAENGVTFTPYSQNAVISEANVAAIDFVGQLGCSGGHGAANFFVATNGNDSWSGTLDCPNSNGNDGPFASLARAQIAVEALLQSHPSSPIVVMVREGTYYLPLSSTRPGTLNFTAADSGTATVPVTWENYPDEVPVLDGGIPVSGWSRVSGDRWQVQLPANTQPFESLYYNGERRLRSRIQSPAAGVGYYMSGGSCISS